MDLTLAQKIEAELSRKGECDAAQLLIVLGGTYPEIYAAIKQLLDEEKVGYGWKGSALIFYLKKMPSKQT